LTLAKARRGRPSVRMGEEKSKVMCLLFGEQVNRRPLVLDVKRKSKKRDATRPFLVSEAVKRDVRGSAKERGRGGGAAKEGGTRRPFLEASPRKRLQISNSGRKKKKEARSPRAGKTPDKKMYNRLLVGRKSS